MMLQGSPPLYSYSVITVDSSPAMSWIHHRMPVSQASPIHIGASHFSASFFKFYSAWPFVSDMFNLFLTKG